MKEGSDTLPKFGDWDLKNPSTASEFSFIFDKARQARKARHDENSSGNSNHKDNENVSLNGKHQRRHYRDHHMVKSNSLLCCFFPSYKP